MRLEQLPTKIRLLAMQRILEQGNTPIQSMCIAGQFIFHETPEEQDFWKEIDVGNFVDPIYTNKTEKKKIIIKLNNVLWNGYTNS
jgi:hypothetical protein